MTLAFSIATHNRLPELQRTLANLAALSPLPDEILVCADGCDDCTAQFVREKFPRVILIEHANPRGSIPSRTELMEAATSDIVVSLDDDSYPLDSDFVARVRELFAANPHIAVAGFPQRSEEFPQSLKQSDFGPSHYAATYSDSGVAYRRSVYKQLEGWPGEFVHAYEEPDYALQCLAAGHAIYYDTTLLIRHHFTNLKRNEIRTHHRHARNEQWSAWRRCPFPDVLAVSPYRALSQLNYARKRGLAWLVREPAWWFSALAGLPAALAKRRPVAARIYRQWIRLARHPIASREEWQAIFGKKS